MKKMLGMGFVGSLMLAGSALANVLEHPGPGARVSGIGMVAGWACEGDLTVEFRDMRGRAHVLIDETPAPHGSKREDTQAACGDVNNGFAAVMNWNNLGSGRTEARLMRNGEVLATQEFTITAFAHEFIEIEGTRSCHMWDFPEFGQEARFVWDNSTQGLVLEFVFHEDDYPDYPNEASFFSGRPLHGWGVGEEEE